eukprot:5841391-Prorocentrum_lima.AAC.1
MSIYLLDGLGLVGENVDILNKAFSIAKAMGMPFIIAGDFNFPPEVLVGHPLLAALDAVVVAPSLPTCHNGER